jgi:hypothetical protein
MEDMVRECMWLYKEHCMGAVLSNFTWIKIYKQA